MLPKLRKSLYLKLFLSFLATCVLFFLGLALFWNQYFADLFYKDKKQLLIDRSSDLVSVVKSVQEGSLSSRELRISMRLISRSFNGQIWILDNQGKVLFSSDPVMEGQSIPKDLEATLTKALKNNSDFFIEHMTPFRPARPEDQGRPEQPPRPGGSYLIYYMPLTLNNQTSVVFLQTPVEDITEVITAVRWNIWVPLLFSLVAVGAILFIMSRKLAGPLREMNRASLALAERNFSIRVPEGKDDEVGQLAQSFNFMIEELERWEDTRQEFLANVSHELRSPLSALRGMIVAMKDGVIPEEKRPHYLQICDLEVQRLGRLVDELLDLARIQNGSDVYRFTLLDPVAKTKEIIDLLAPVIKSKDLQFEVWMTGELPSEPVLVRLDPDRYAQILNNLLHNAMKFTPEGNRISVHLEVRHEEFQVEISDTGCGMSEEEMKRIWDRFYKADPSRTGKDGGGTGLGLTIAKHLVNGMNGHISVRSRAGQGTTFSVLFPLVKSDGIA
ncbi:sensor histidine kinase [Gorillibacterium sp. sgz5001074]|uniref:sensor histidine kinase n=1 Tax=Gorillibacterium sp. sgz5001074 TaxID=3446695 RepID=UPI003F67CF45